MVQVKISVLSKTWQNILSVSIDVACQNTPSARLTMAPLVESVSNAKARDSQILVLIYINLGVALILIAVACNSFSSWFSKEV